MASNIVDEYLVALTYHDDPKELQKLDSFLGSSNRLATAHISGLAKAFLEIDATVTAGFNALGIGALAFVDHAAKSDQQFRLLGERTFQTTQQVRELDAVQKILGADLSQIAFDPELREQAQGLRRNIQEINGALGEGYEDRLKSFRAATFQFGLLRYGIEQVASSSLSTVFDTLAGGPGKAQEKLQQLNDYIAKNFPEISKQVAGYLKPVFNDWIEILKHLQPLFADIGHEALRFIGILTGDSKLQDGKLSIENIGRAVDDVSHGLASFADHITNTLDMVVHLTAAVGDLAHAAFDFAHGDFKKAAGDIGDYKNDLTQANKKLGPVEGGVLGSSTGFAGGAMAGALTGGVSLGPLGIIPGAVLGGGLGALSGGSVGALFGKLKGDAEDPNRLLEATHRATAHLKDIAKLDNYGIDFAGLEKAHKLPEGILKGIALTESQGNQYGPDGKLLRSKAGAEGLFQIMPANAAKDHVDLSDPKQAANEAAKLLADNFKRFGDERLAITAYNEGGGNLNQALQGKHVLPQEAREYAATVQANRALAMNQTPPRPTRDYMERAGQGNAKPPQITQTITIPVTVQGGGDEKKITANIMQEIQRKQNMQMIAALADASGVHNY